MPSTKPPRGSHRPFIEELERRLLLSADFPALLADPDLADPGTAPAQYDSDLQTEDAAGQLLDGCLCFIDVIPVWEPPALSILPIILI